MKTMKNIKVYKDAKGFPVYVCEGPEINYNSRTVYNTSEKIYQLAKEIGLDRLAEEYVYIFMFDTRMHLIGFSEVSHGTVNMSVSGVREVFLRAVSCNASSIIVLHNHPSGIPTPSDQDKESTEKTKKAGELLGINLVDHIIVGDGNYYSFRDEKTL